MHCNRYRISGQVQGVFYRASTQQEAVRLGLVGWVRNMSDGCVEAAACGTQAKLNEFEAWLKQGPPMAVVDRVDVQTEMSVVSEHDFEIRY